MTGSGEYNKNKIANHFFWGAVFATTFVAYGSLVPFVYRAHSFSDSLAIFLNIPFLSLGVSSRADWIANAVIYIPISFAWCGYFSSRNRSGVSFGLLMVLMGLMAIIIEYLQIFVAPRTVSLNDLLAEICGILIGAGVWMGTKDFVLSHLEIYYRTGKISIRAILSVYAFCYVLFSLFPFDFYISGDELANALESKGIPLFALRNWQEIDIKQLAMWGVNFCIIMPFGYFYGRHRAGRLPSQKIIFSVSLAIFLLLDLIQFFTASGRSFFISALVSSLGVLAGVESGKRWSFQNSFSHIRKIRGFIYLGMVPFILISLSVRGWQLVPVGSVETLTELLGKINFTPFYYHYFTTEIRALLSVIAQISLVAPVGGLLALNDCIEHRRHPRSWRLLALWGALFSLFFEAGGLFWSGLKPDPTNLLIGALAVVLVYKGVSLILKSLTGGKKNDDQGLESGIPLEQLSSEPLQRPFLQIEKRFSVIRGMALAASLGVLSYVVNYPLSTPLLLLGVVGYLILLWYRPVMWIIVVAAAVPLLDLYPLSGRFFMTEFDLVILLTVAIKYGMGQVSFRFLKKDLPFTMLFGGIALIYFVSTLRVLWPLPDIGLNSFNSYYSEFNSLRVGKGFLWAFLLLPVVEYELRKDVLSFIRLSYGMILGLALVCLVVVLERGLFTGLFNFSSNAYRVTGSFASMHTGGSHIDSYLVTMLPFIAVPVLLKNKLNNIILYSGLLLLVLYTIFVTYSRGPYFIAAAVGFLLAGGLVFSSHNKVKKRYIFLMSVGFLTLAGGWIALPMSYDTVLSKRLDGVEKDQQTRLSHWKNTLKGVTANFSDRLLGFGPGSFPKNLYVEKAVVGKKIAVHNLVSKGGNTFLRLHGGDNIYTSQFITIDPEQKYQLRFKVKSSRGKAVVSMPLCERWITDSFRCARKTFNLKVSPGQWTEVQHDIDMAGFQQRLSRFEGFIRRPVALSIYTSSRGGAIDIDDVEVLDSSGRNLLNNGNYELGKDHWFFVVDNHLLWHTKNLAVNVIYDLGILGLVFIVGLLLLAIVRLIRMIFAGEQLAAVLLASISGYLGVGVVGSLFDVPQLSFLLFFLISVVMVMWQEFSKSGSAN